MRENGKVRRLAIVLLIVMILFGALITQIYLTKALNEKRFLTAVTYLPLDAAAEQETESESVSVGSVSVETDAEETASDIVVYEDSSETIDAVATLSSQSETAADAEDVTIQVVDLSDTSGSVVGTRIDITAASESSSISQEGYSNTAYEAYDGALNTSWQEGVDGAGEGSWLTYTFDGMHWVRSIVFYLGVWNEANGKDYYHNNYRPKEIEIRIGEDSWIAEFGDEKVAHLVSFSSPVEASEITFTILSVYASNNYQDTGIAEIIILE